MHIIVLENEPSSQRGGQELSLLDICRGLHHRGHQISLLYRQSGNLLQQYKSFCLEVIPVKQYMLDRQHPHQLATGFHQAIRAVSAEPQSLIYCNQYQDSFFGGGLAHWQRIPLICHLRLPPPCKLDIQSKLGLKGADRFIAISQKTRSDWATVGLDLKKIEVIYNGISSQVQVPQIPADRSWQDLTSSKLMAPTISASTTIAYVGRLDKVKGIETLIKAIAFLAPQAPSLRLLIAGKPLIQCSQYQAALERLAQQLGIESQVQFLGHVADPSQVYRSSQVMVLPSIWAEPFGRTTLEAMACGVPVVTSRVGGIPEVLLDEFAQGLFEPGNAEDLAAKLQYFLKWQAQDRHLGQRCQSYVSDRFPLSQTIAGVEQIMLKALRLRVLG